MAYFEKHDDGYLHSFSKRLKQEVVIKAPRKLLTVIYEALMFISLCNNDTFMCYIASSHFR